MTETDILTVHEVAEYLKVKDRTIYRLLGHGEIPDFKVGGSWNFTGPVIDQWTEAPADKPGERDDRTEKTQ